MFTTLLTTARRQHLFLKFPRSRPIALLTQRHGEIGHRRQCARMFLAKQMTVALQRLFLKLPCGGIASLLGVVFFPSGRHSRIDNLCYRSPDPFGHRRAVQPHGISSVVASQMETHDPYHLLAKTHKYWRFHCDSVAAKNLRTSLKAEKLFVSAHSGRLTANAEVWTARPAPERGRRMAKRRRAIGGRDFPMWLRHPRTTSMDVRALTSSLRQLIHVQGQVVGAAKKRGFDGAPRRLPSNRTPLKDTTDCESSCCKRERLASSHPSEEKRIVWRIVRHVRSLLESPGKAIRDHPEREHGRC